MATLNVAPALSAYDLRDGRLIEGKSFREVFVSLAVSRTAANIYNFFNGKFGMRKCGPARYAPARHHISLVVGVRSYTKMLHVAAQRIIARMKKMPSIGDFPFVHGPNETVSLPRARTYAVKLPDGYEAVTSRGERAGPLQAAGFAPLQAPLQKAPKRAVFLFGNRRGDRRAALCAGLFHPRNIYWGLPHGN